MFKPPKASESDFTALMCCTSQDSSAKELDGCQTSAAEAMRRPSGSRPITNTTCSSLLRKRRSICPAFQESRRLSRRLSSCRRRGKCNVCMCLHLSASGKTTRRTRQGGGVWSVIIRCVAAWWFTLTFSFRLPKRKRKEKERKKKETQSSSLLAPRQEWESDTTVGRVNQPSPLPVPACRPRRYDMCLCLCGA